MKSKRSRTYLVSGLTLALIFVAIILVFRDVLPDIVKDLSTVPFWGVLLLLTLGFAYGGDGIRAVPRHHPPQKAGLHVY